MYRYQILVEYVGTKFVGWQKQLNGKSVQKALALQAGPPKEFKKHWFCKPGHQTCSKNTGFIQGGRLSHVQFV